MTKTDRRAAEFIQGFLLVQQRRNPQFHGSLAVRQAAVFLSAYSAAHPARKEVDPSLVPLALRGFPPRVIPDKTNSLPRSQIQCNSCAPRVAMLFTSQFAQLRNRTKWEITGAEETSRAANTRRADYRNVSIISIAGRIIEKSRDTIRRCTGIQYRSANIPGWKNLYRNIKRKCLRAEINLLR